MVSIQRHLDSCFQRKSYLLTVLGPGVAKPTATPREPFTSRSKGLAEAGGGWLGKEDEEKDDDDVAVACNVLAAGKGSDPETSSLTTNITFAPIRSSTNSATRQHGTLSVKKLSFHNGSQATCSARPPLPPPPPHALLDNSKTNVKMNMSKQKRM